MKRPIVLGVLAALVISAVAVLGYALTRPSSGLKIGTDNVIELAADGTAHIVFDAPRAGQLGAAIVGGDFGGEELSLQLQTDDPRFKPTELPATDDATVPPPEPKVDVKPPFIIAQASTGGIKADVAKGPVTLVVKGIDGAGQVQLEVRFGPPSDVLEPNNTAALATMVDLPFKALLTVTDADPDWIAIEPPKGRFVAIDYLAPNYSQRKLAVYDDKMVLRYSSDYGIDSGAPRYVKAVGGKMFVMLAEQGNAVEPNQIARSVRISLADVRTADAGTIVILDDALEPDSQLEIAAELQGVEVIRAADPAAISQRLDQTIEAAVPHQGFWTIWWAYIVGGLVVLGGAIAALVIARRRRAQPAPVIEEDAT